MKSATQNIFEQALRLNPVERAKLIDELFHSFDQTMISGLTLSGQLRQSQG